VHTVFNVSLYALCNFIYALCYVLQGIIEDVTGLVKRDESHKVITQGLATLLRLGQLVNNTSTHQKLITLAKQVSGICYIEVLYFDRFLSVSTCAINTLVLKIQV
jgi:hypothetical protein